MKKKVLFLCTGNSCRSIMAEALLNHLGGNSFEAYSAGSDPVGFVHRGTFNCLERHDIPISDDLKSKSWEEFEDIDDFYAVITVCDSAAEEPCPYFPGNHLKYHWGTIDPAKVEGGPSRSEPVFDEAFHFLKEKIERLINDLDDA